MIGAPIGERAVLRRDERLGEVYSMAGMDPVIPVFPRKTGRSMRDRMPKTRQNDRLLLKLFLEKYVTTLYTSSQLAKSRRLKLHRRLSGAGGFSSTGEYQKLATLIFIPSFFGQLLILA